MRLFDALQFWRAPMSAFVGVCFGVMAVLGTPEIVGSLRSAYDSLRPVLRMSGVIASRDADAVILHISGEKMRGEECRLLAVYGYSVGADGLLKDADAKRIDAPQVNRQRDKGVYDIGLWRVGPIAPDAVGVRVVAQHDCVGRVILSTIAEASL